MENNIDYNSFYKDRTNRAYFSNTNENLLCIKQDSQGYNWTDDFFERTFKSRLNDHRAFRCVKPISSSEKLEREKFHISKKTDIFFQYKFFVPNIKIKYAHFQVRKNFHMLTNDHGQGTELVYGKKYGIESFNLVNKKTQTLCSLSQQEELDSNKQMICFDVMKKDNGDYLICLGQADGSLNLYNVSNSEMKRVKRYKTDIMPKFENYLTKVIAEGNTSDLLTCHVRFINKNNNSYLLTTCNDGCVKLFDMNEGMNLMQVFKSNFPVNHCDFNSKEDILGCVGDSKFVELYDVKTSKMNIRFTAHNDFGTSLKFKPESDYIFATANQDYSCKIWDVRKLNQDKDKMFTPVKFLSGYFENVGDLFFTKNSKEQFLFFAENADYLHIYNMKHDTIQTTRYLGYYCGMAYEEWTERIYLGIEGGDQFSGIMCYDKVCSNNFNSMCL